jgi:hypothetical protein
MSLLGGLSELPARLGVQRRIVASERQTRATILEAIKRAIFS